MSGATLSFSGMDVDDALRNFLLAILPDGTDVVQGQDNRVPEPLADDFVVMTGTSLASLSTTVEHFDMTPGASSMTAQGNNQMGVQLDVHGDASEGNAWRIVLAWRSAWAAAFFRGSIIAPLSVDDPRQTPFMNAEEQYETRWTVTVYVQAKPVLTLPQDYATVLAIETQRADQ